MDLKKIDFTKSTIEGSDGVIFKISDSLSLERYKKFELLQSKLGYGIDFENINNKINEAITLNNKGKATEGWTILVNMRDQIGISLEKRIPTAMDICMLFINTLNEDLTTIDEQHMQWKLTNLEKAGYDAQSFFQLAANSVSGFMDALTRTFQITSNLEK